MPKSIRISSRRTQDRPITARRSQLSTGTALSFAIQTGDGRPLDGRRTHQTHAKQIRHQPINEYFIRSFGSEELSARIPRKNVFASSTPTNNQMRQMKYASSLLKVPSATLGGATILCFACTPKFGCESQPATPTDQENKSHANQASCPECNCLACRSAAACRSWATHRAGWPLQDSQHGEGRRRRRL